MERCIVEESLFDGIFEDIIAYLSEKSGKEIPEWHSYKLDYVEYISPNRRYHVTLLKGPPKYPGKVVAHIAVDVIPEAENVIVLIKWKL